MHTYTHVHTHTHTQPPLSNRPRRSFFHEFSYALSVSPFSLAAGPVFHVSYDTPTRTRWRSCRTDRPSLHETLVVNSRGTEETCGILTTQRQQRQKSPLRCKLAQLTTLYNQRFILSFRATEIFKKKLFTCLFVCNILSLKMTTEKIRD